MTNITDWAADDPVPRHHHVHALGGTHLKTAALLGQGLDLVGPHPGRVDHDVAANLGDRAVFGVADADPGHPVALAQQRDHLGGASHDRAVVRRGARDRHRVPGVVDDGVVVADPADQRAALQPRAQPQRAGTRQMLLRGNRFRAAEAVVEEDTRRGVGTLPPPMGQREQERQRLDQVRRQRGQRQLALMERLAHQPELQLLEVAQPTMEHLRRAARGAGSEVARLDERDLEPARGGIQGAPGAHHAAADHHDVELLGAESLPERRALRRAEHGNRIIHDEGLLTGEFDVRVTRQ
jgi:hypothetical protein